MFQLMPWTPLHDHLLNEISWNKLKIFLNIERSVFYCLLVLRKSAVILKSYSLIVTLSSYLGMCPYDVIESFFSHSLQSANNSFVYTRFKAISLLPKSVLLIFFFFCKLKYFLSNFLALWLFAIVSNERQMALVLQSLLQRKRFSGMYSHISRKIIYYLFEVNCMSSGVCVCKFFFFFKSSENGGESTRRWICNQGVNTEFFNSKKKKINEETMKSRLMMKKWLMVRNGF